MRLPTFCSDLLLPWILLLVRSCCSSYADCSPEFSNCVTNRDCCQGTQCVTGDWAITTDSTCLSDRSIRLNALDLSLKTRLVVDFYAQFVDNENNKSPLAATELATKYHKRGEFAQLVVRLERKYATAIDEKSLEEKNDEL